MPKVRKWLKKRQYQPTFAIKNVATNQDIERVSGQLDVISEQHLVPYDENLLERSRTQWQFGDWASLAALERDTLQHHPDRAKLALLAAAGHAQLGNATEARQHTRLAQDWGCSKKLVSQIMISGVHNTLGRAAVTIGNQQHRALLHFDKAISIGTPGSDIKLLSQVRHSQQLIQLGLSASQPNLEVGLVDHTDALMLALPTIRQGIEALSQSLAEQKADLDAQLKKQNDTLSGLRKHIDSKLKEEMLNATQQLEAFLDIQSFFNNGEQLPTMHGWPISPDFARYLIQLIDKGKYDLILEFGSGTSTVLIAKALAKLQRARQEKPTVVQVAFEHLAKYHAQTLADLASVGMATSVQLNLTPLQPYKAPNGQTYSYYACHQTLADLVANMPTAPSKILLVVDGPPGSTGKHARYPCLPAVLAHFKNKHIDILLDDYARADEKEVGVLWQQELNQIGYQVSSEKISMEKDALLITATPQ